MAEQHEQFVLLPDQPKTAIPENVQKSILEQWDKVTAARQKLMQLQGQIIEMNQQARAQVEQFFAYIKVTKSMMNVPASWDLTPEADFFYEPTHEQLTVLPAEARTELEVTGQPKEEAHRVGHDSEGTYIETEHH